MSVPVFSEIIGQQHAIQQVSARIVAIRDKLIGALPVDPSAVTEEQVSDLGGLLGDVQTATYASRTPLAAASVALDEIEKVLA